MTFSFPLRALTAGLLAIIGSALFWVEVDRELVSAPPIEGSAAGLVLQSNTVYTERISTPANNLACLGLFLRPVTKNLPADVVQIVIKNHGAVLGEGSIATSFIDAEGASRACFAPPLSFPANPDVSFDLSVPASLNNTLRAQLSNLESKTIASLTSQTYQPPLAKHLGGLLLLAALLPIIPLPKNSLLFIGVYSVGLATIFLLPFMSTPLPLLTLLILFLWFVVSSLSLAIVLRQDNLSLLPLLFGLHILAYTSWAPLNLTQFNPATIVHSTTNLRDIFLDPNQLVGIEKHGSYVGLMPVLLAAIGIIRTGRSRWPLLLVGGLGLVIATVPPLAPVLARFLPLPPQHFIILTTLAISFFAAHGLAALAKYLKSYTVTPILIFALTYLALLDLWQVATLTLQSLVIQ